MFYVLGYINCDRCLHIHHADNSGGVFVGAHELSRAPRRGPSVGCSARYVLFPCFSGDNNISCYLGFNKQHLRPYVQAEAGLQQGEDGGYGWT